MQPQDDELAGKSSEHTLAKPLPLRPVGPHESFPRGRPSTFLAIAAAGGVTFLLISALTPAVQGATRSTKLKWQQRQQEIDEAQAADSALSVERDKCDANSNEQHGD